MTRTRELVFRAVNAGLIGALNLLHRRFSITTTYKISPDGIAALFEDSWFAYHPREFGCSGNIDYMPEAENATREALFTRIEDHQVFYDVGAHGGVYTVTLKRRFPSLTIHSFEPQPEDLLQNLRLNQLSVENVHPVAVGAAPGSAQMTTKKRSSNHVSVTGNRRVKMVRIDDYARDMNLPPPDWIKIDIEGLELPALQGAERILLQSRPIVICEINQLFGRFGTTIREFLDYMRSLHYRPHRLVHSSLEAIGPAETLADLGQSADNNYWFIPE